MKNPIKVIGLATLALLSSSVATASETRDQLSRFWKLAEDRVQLQTQASQQAQQIVEPRVPEPPARFSSSRVTTPVVSPTPRPAVTARQSDRSDSRQGSFGLEILGGLDLFNFTWGDKRQQSEDSIVGEL